MLVLHYASKREESLNIDTDGWFCFIFVSGELHYITQKFIKSNFVFGNLGPIQRGGYFYCLWLFEPI